MKFIRPKQDSDRGAAAIEFALIMVPLFLLVGGIVDFGYIFAQKIALNQAVREGARVAVVQPVGTPPTTTSLVRNAAADSFIANPTAIAVSTSGSCSSPGIGNNLEVTATYVTSGPLGLVGALTFGQVDLDNVTLTSQATFRCEW